MLRFLVSTLACALLVGHSLAIIPQDYDYVVVGGGTAGIAVAQRLAQTFQVALVEAGDYYQIQSFAKIPAACILPVGSDPSTRASIDWGFVTQPQEGLRGRRVHYARGKCLGGSSALNFMLYQRPPRGAMDRWAELVNDSSYAWDQTFPFFTRSVQFTPPDPSARPANATASFDPAAYSPQGGPLQVSMANQPASLASWVQRGMRAIGIPDIRDFNLGRLMGSQYCTTTITPRKRERSSSQSAFLGLAHPNLTVYSVVVAQRILFDNNRRAIGVSVVGVNGEPFAIAARREVVLSAGAFQSPQLLMLSGIGPEQTLRAHGIDVLVDLPGVGQNMWDHIYFPVTYRVKVDTFTRLVIDLPYALVQVLDYVLRRRGVLTGQVGDYLAFEKIPPASRQGFSDRTRDELGLFPADWPEVEYLSASGAVGNTFNFILVQPRDGYEYGSIVGTIVAPLSRGNVTLLSTDARDLPLVNPNWLSSPTDQQLATAIFRRMRQAFESPAMAPVLIGGEYFPGPQVQTDDEILRHVQDNAMTIWHAACTCKMGRSDDPLAVVDHEARVFGVSGLRVVDASAFPLLPPGHPQSVVYMLAEKISSAIISG